MISQDHRFDWGLHPAAEEIVDETVQNASEASPRLRALGTALATRTSTRLQDWLDHVSGPVEPDRLAAAGFVAGYGTAPQVWRHPKAQLPAVVPGPRWRVALRVDDAAAFAAAQGSTVGVEGSPLSGFRTAVVSAGEEVVLAGVERRSWACGVRPEIFSHERAIQVYRAWTLLAERSRGLGGVEEVVKAIHLAREAVGLAGRDLAASFFLELERRHWQRRNTAGALQHARQDRLGLGWGNNDHHTFRSSRTAFNALMRLLVEFGFVPREQFYAGADAGWGAQVLEHPGCGGVIFADLDLDGHEIGIDFSTTTLAERAELGTVGLWCALHGESVLAAGMHHLEGQFDFDRLRDDLAVFGVGQMTPFSDFAYLRQAFTEAERWPVPADRLRRLVDQGRLDPRSAEEFARMGAPGSHLENLARRNGFKGFNQTNVSITMRATDPRHYRPAELAPAAGRDHA